MPKLTQRAALVALILASPGSTGPALAAHFGLTVGAINSPLSVAIKRGEIVRRRVPSLRYPNIGQWAYFPV